MALQFEEKRVICEGALFENEVEALRDYLASTAPEPIMCDLSRCDDLHTALSQQFLAYAMHYGCDFTFSEQSSAYKKLLTGFERSENHCH